MRGLWRVRERLPASRSFRRRGSGDMRALRYLKAELQSKGVRSPVRERMRGAGPAAGVTLVLGDTIANVPVTPHVADKSPYSIKRQEGKLFLKRGENLVLEVEIPSPKFYELKTRDGIPYKKVALLHGKDCLATTLIQKRIHWNAKRCKFCGIELSLQSGETIERKTPEQLLEVALAAKKEGVKHVTITTGTPPTRDKGILAAADAARLLKDEAKLDIHVQFEPPYDLSLLKDLKARGADTVGIHIECFDKRVLSEVAPAKAEMHNAYMRVWEEAVGIFGENQVSSYLIVGMGESDESVFDGCKVLAELGVYPFVVPFRPIPGTDFGKKMPPSYERMRALYEEVTTILRDAGLSWRKNKAGCVRCRACSALPDFEVGL
ncbi:MAG: MSMEG_0568 family radical SAM protein [Candidatus Alkanophagales archaeon]|nr:MAG: MSMEG_0568 family radical SAM protein [Candidatus Alkanophagales archaeon]